MKRVLSLLLFSAAIFVGGCATPGRDIPPAKATSATVDVKLIAFNDFHGNLKTPNLRVPVPDDPIDRLSP